MRVTLWHTREWSSAVQPGATALPLPACPVAAKELWCAASEFGKNYQFDLSQSS